MSNETLYIEAQDDTPMVKQELNGPSSIITISGVSMPENTLDFYTPLLKQIEQICSATTKNRLIFHLDYMNSMSNKQVLKLISAAYQKDSELQVLWKFSSDDDLIKLKGEEMKSLLDGVDFSIEEVPTL